MNSPDSLLDSQGGGRAGVTPTPPAAKKTKLDPLHERRAARLEATRREEPTEQNERGMAGVQHKGLLTDELPTYLAEKVQPEDDDLCLLRS